MSASNSFDPINILDSTNASGIGTGGSLTVSGGISIGRDSFIGGNLEIYGTTTSFADNIILINKNPQSNIDTGVIFQRGENSYSSIIYSAESDEYRFGWINTEPSRGSVNLSDFTPIKVKSISILSTEENSIYTPGSTQLLGPNHTLGSITVNGSLVGINKTSPSYALDVVGSIRSSSNLISDSLSVSGTSTFGGSLVPSTTLLYDLGSNDLRWNDLYLSGNTIYLGDKTLSFQNESFQIDNLQLNGTVDSISSTTGTLCVAGGVGINKSVHIKENLTVNGDVFINGTTTTIDTTTTTIEDNLLVLNSGPASLADAGILMKRFSDGISSTVGNIYAGIFYKESTDEITLGYTDSDPGTSPVTITDYIPLKASKLALLNTSDATNASNGGVLTVAGGGAFGKSIYIGDGVFAPRGTVANLVASTTLSTGTLRATSVLGTSGTVGNLVASTTLSTGTLRVSGTANAVVVSSGNIWSGSGVFGSLGTIGTLACTTLSILSSTDSTNATTGAVVLSGGGGLSISDTVNATNASNGGALTIAGGAAVGGSLFFGDGLFGPIGTIGNLVATTTLSTGTLRATSVFGTSGTIGNLVATTTLSTGTLRATSVFGTSGTIGNLVATTTLSTGTLRATTAITTNVSTTNITSGTIRATTSIIATGTIVATNTSNTLGSIVTTGGNIGIGTVAPTSTLHVIGSGVFTSTTNATGVGTGGALTVGGGASIANDLYVGGNTFVTGNVVGNNWRISSQSTSFSIGQSDRNTLYIVTGETTVTLPTPTLNFCIGINKNDSVTSQITILPNTISTKINGKSNYVLSTTDETVILISDGSNWKTIGTQNFVFASVYSLPGSYTFTVPNPISTVYACVFGGGGGGGNGAVSGSGNGGGGGGYCEGIISVSPGDSLTITVGEGGGAGVAGESSSVGDLLATGGGAGGTNSSGSWGSNGSAGSGSGGSTNRVGGSGGQSPSQTSGGGGGGGGAGRNGIGNGGNGYIGGNGSSGYGGSGRDSVITNGESIRIANSFREGGGGASGNLSGASTSGADGGFPGGGGSGSAGGNSAGSGGSGCVVIFY